MSRHSMKDEDRHKHRLASGVFGACLLGSVFFQPFFHVTSPDAASPNLCQAFNFHQNSNGNANAKPHVAQLHDKVAVVIGISNFKDPAIPPCPAADSSALAVASVFEDRNVGRFKFQNIVLLKGVDADLTHVAELLNTGVTRRALQSDMIVLYISARTAVSRDGKRLLLCCSDSSMDNIDATALDLQTTLSTIKKRIQSKNIICLLDLSPVPQGNKHVPATLDVERLANDTGITILSANDLRTESQVAPQTMTGPNTMTYFAYFLVENLKYFKGTVALLPLAQAVTDQVRRSTGTSIQSPRLALALDNPEISNLAIGLQIKKPDEHPFAHVRFGFDPSRLAIDHPELLPGAGNPSQQDVSFTKRSRHEETVAANNSANRLTTRADLPPGINLKNYIKSAKTSIHAKWNPPKGFEGKKVIVSFKVIRDGSIEDPQIIEASGAETIDSSALAALKAASPLQPLPDGSVESLRLRYEFDGGDNIEKPQPVEDRSQQ